MNSKSKTKESEIRISPIGRVKKTSEYQGCLEISGPYREALKELNGFSHINVFWWCHLSDTEALRNVLTCAKPYQKAPDSVGVFATRSQRRPNPVALTVVSVINIDHDRGVIDIPFIDAADNSPIIDIKPYHPATDRVKEVSVPDWCRHWPEWYEDAASFDWAAEFVFPA